MRPESWNVSFFWKQSFKKLSINTSFCISDATFLLQHINLDANAFCSSHQQLSLSSAPVSSPSSSSAITTQALITNRKPNPTQPPHNPNQTQTPSCWPLGSIPSLLSPSASVSSSCRLALHLNLEGVLCKCGIRHSTTSKLTLSKAPQIWREYQE